MRIRFGIGPAGVIKQVAGQSVQTRVFSIMALPIVPLGTLFVTDQIGTKKQQGYSVPLFSWVGLTSLVAAYARAYFFLLWSIPLIAIFKSSAGAGTWVFCAVMFGSWLGALALGGSNAEQRYQQLLLGFATGVAAQPQWLKRKVADALGAQLEATWSARTPNSEADLDAVIHGRRGDIRDAAVAYAVARYRALSDDKAKTQAEAALAWAHALLTLEELQKRVLTSSGRMRGLNVEVSNTGVTIGEQRVFADPDGSLVAASVVVFTAQSLELGVLDRMGVERALQELKAGSPAASALGAKAARIAYNDLRRIEVRGSARQLDVFFRDGEDESSRTISAADLEQRDGLVEALKQTLGSRFVEGQRPAFAETLVGGGFMLLVVALIGFMSFSHDEGRVIALLGLLGSLYWIVQRLRNPPMIKCVERKQTPSIAPAA